MKSVVFSFATKKEVNRAYDSVSLMSVADSNGPFFELDESEKLITVVWHEADKAEKQARDSIVRLVEEFGGHHILTPYEKVA